MVRTSSQKLSRSWSGNLPETILLAFVMQKSSVKSFRPDNLIVAGFLGSKALLKTDFPDSTGHKQNAYSVKLERTCSGTLPKIIAFVIVIRKSSESCIVVRPHSKNYVANFTFLVRRINVNRHTTLRMSFCFDSTTLIIDFTSLVYFIRKIVFWSARDSNPRPLGTLFSIKTPNRNYAFSAIPLLEI
jgi:hypothetical protein